MAELQDEKLISKSDDSSFDYSHVLNPARIAVYDDFKSPPRIVVIEPTNTDEFIEKLASTIYQLSKQMQGKIPYTVIREVSENFIHARFSEIVVSIYNQGNTLRFSDQGPGIVDKDKVTLPGYTSAIEPMKHYIRGVGSGLPTVKDYLEIFDGQITIDDNIGKGAIVTISLDKETSPTDELDIVATIQNLTGVERELMMLFRNNALLGITDIVKQTGKAQSSISYQLDKLVEAGLLEKTAAKKRKPTSAGSKVADYLATH